MPQSLDTISSRYNPVLARDNPADVTMYTHMHACTYVNTNAHTFAYVYMQTHAMYARMHAVMHACTHMHKPHTRMHAHTTRTCKHAV